MPANGIAWIYGAGGIQYVFARDPKLDVTTYKPDDHKERLLQVSRLMDSTNPDLSRFAARGGKLVILENMADYAQSPYAGIRYFENVQRKLGKEKTAEFARLYTAPGVDHVGSGAPANVDMLAVLVDWVENGKAPGDLEVTEQKVEAPAFETTRALPLVPVAGMAALQIGSRSIARPVLPARREEAWLCCDRSTPHPEEPAKRASRRM